MLKVDKQPALRAGWAFLTGKLKLRQDVPESILMGLPKMQPTSLLGEPSEATCSETESSPAGPTIHIIAISDV